MTSHLCTQNINAQNSAHVKETHEKYDSYTSAQNCFIADVTSFKYTHWGDITQSWGNVVPRSTHYF